MPAILNPMVGKFRQICLEKPRRTKTFQALWHRPLDLPLDQASGAALTIFIEENDVFGLPAVMVAPWAPKAFEIF